VSISLATKWCTCTRQIIFDDNVGMHVHVDTQDIFCDEAYTSMATVSCALEEKLSKHMLLRCHKEIGHTTNHYGIVAGVTLEWRDDEKGEWDEQ
jgi:hypothetical protein